MKCSECNEREATRNYTKVENNKKITKSLCKECAEKLGFHSPLDNMPFPLADLLSSMSTGYGGSGQPGAIQERIECSTCGLTFEDFARQGRFGCGGCYTSFRPRLEAIMRKIHGNSIHRGRNPGMVPDSANSQVAPIKEEERVASELRKAIEDEDFERAAELRDKLKSIRDGFPVDN
ncbi:hypothetical protein GF420_03175 [candidate division GN15 bacterium]|nr:hypothetical protein [candidate division GN15 bacterium]